MFWAWDLSSRRTCGVDTSGTAGALNNGQTRIQAEAMINTQNLRAMSCIPLITDAPSQNLLLRLNKSLQVKFMRQAYHQPLPTAMPLKWWALLHWPGSKPGSRSHLVCLLRDSILS